MRRIAEEQENNLRRQQHRELQETRQREEAAQEIYDIEQEREQVRRVNDEINQGRIRRKETNNRGASNWENKSGREK